MSCNEKNEEGGPLFNEFKRKVMSRDPDVDTSFGIRFLPDGTMKMGNKLVTIDQDDNIHVENKVYAGTPGLWRLITGVTRDQIGHVDYEYTQFDLLEYVNLMKQTSAMHQDYDPNNLNPRQNKSWKWRKFLKEMWEDFKKERESAVGEGLNVHDPQEFYIQKGGLCCRVQTRGDGLFLSPSVPYFRGDGLFLKVGGNFYDGKGLLKGKDSFVKKYPLLTILL